EESDQPPGPEADHKERRHPGEYLAHPCPSPVNVEDVERPTQQQNRQTDQHRRQPLDRDRGRAPGHPEQGQDARCRSGGRRTDQRTHGARQTRQLLLHTRLLMSPPEGHGFSVWKSLTTSRRGLPGSLRRNCVQFPVQPSTRPVTLTTFSPRASASLRRRKGALSPSLSQSPSTKYCSLPDTFNRISSSAAAPSPWAATPTPRSRLPAPSPKPQA